VFKLGTNLYDPDLNHLETMTRYYNCSELGSPTYDETNIYPYCKELYNSKLVPFGFHSIRLSEQYTKGFPVFFDINLSYERAQDFYLYVEEGHYIEESETRDVRVQVGGVSLPNIFLFSPRGRAEDCLGNNCIAEKCWLALG
jgi:hypothetical protein